MATDLDLQFDARGPRDPGTVRRLGAPRPVLEAEWSRAGDLDVWLVGPQGEWYGRVCDPDEVYRWVSGRDLRPE